jgi:hypothetical protein
MKKSNWHGGKGSARRNSNEKAYADNWEEIFGKARPNISTRQNSLFHANVKVNNNAVDLPYVHNNDDMDEMLSAYLQGVLPLSTDCPVTNIEAYETGKFLKSSSNCGIKCYRLANEIRRIRKNK